MTPAEKKTALQRRQLIARQKMVQSAPPLAITPDMATGPAPPPRADAPPSPVQAPQPPSGFMNVAEDVVKSGAAGLARGSAALVGLPGTITDLADSGMKKLGLLREDAPGSALSGASLTAGLSQVSGGATDYQGETRAGKFAGTVGEFVPGAAALSGGRLVGGVMRYGVAAAIGSEAAGQATEGTKAEPWARFIGALVAPAAVALAGNTARRVVSPLGGADPERLKLAKVLDDFNVPVTAGQRTGSEGLRRSEASSLASGARWDVQSEAFTKAALGTTGSTATRATPEVLTKIADDIGATFDDVMRGVDVTPDSAMVTALANANSTYRSLAPKATVSPYLGNVLKEVVKIYRGGGTIPASTLKVWRSNLSKLTTSADEATREAAIVALNAVDDGMNVALTAAGRTDDIARLVTARGQYRNFLAVRDAASRAGEEAANGIISPARLASAVTRQGRAAQAMGRRGDIGSLARAGSAVMSPLPTVSSGGRRVVEGMVPMLMAGTGGATLGPAGVLLGAVPQVGRELLAGPMQGYLANQLAGAGRNLLSMRAVGSIPGTTAQ